MNSEFKIVIGIDPGTGAKSGTGIAIFNPELKQIMSTFCIKPDGKTPLHVRIQEISNEIKELVVNRYPAKVSLYCMEHFVMRGKSGETLQKLIGGIMSIIPESAKFVEVHNMTIKKEMGGISKEEVAAGVLNWFKGGDEITVRSLIEGGHWDITDALAIGIVGYEGLNKNEPTKKLKKR